MFNLKILWYNYSRLILLFRLFSIQDLIEHILYSLKALLNIFSICLISFRFYLESFLFNHHISFNILYFSFCSIIFNFNSQFSSWIFLNSPYVFPLIFNPSLTVHSSFLSTCLSPSVSLANSHNLRTIYNSIYPHWTHTHRRPYTTLHYRRLFIIIYDILFLCNCSLLGS